MKIVVTQRQRLDELVNKHYGDLAHFNDVMDINDITEVYLEVGDEVELPEYEEKTKTYSEAGGLW